MKREQDGKANRAMNALAYADLLSPETKAKLKKIVEEKSK